MRQWDSNHIFVPETACGNGSPSPEKRRRDPRLPQGSDPALLLSPPGHEVPAQQHRGASAFPLCLPCQLGCLAQHPGFIQTRRRFPNPSRCGAGSCQSSCRPPAKAASSRPCLHPVFFAFCLLPSRHPKSASIPAFCSFCCFFFLKTQMGNSRSFAAALGAASLGCRLVYGAEVWGISPCSPRASRLESGPLLRSRT